VSPGGCRCSTASEGRRSLRVVSMAAEAHSVQFYTKAECHLCDDARCMLLSLGSRYPLSVAEVDITSDEALLWSYGEAIPVIVVDGQFTLAGRIAEVDLEEWLEEFPVRPPRRIGGVGA